MSQQPPIPLGPALLQGNSVFPTSLALLMLRLVLGWTFIYHGAQLCFGAFNGPSISRFASGLQGMPILPPIAWAYIAAYGQFLGGLSMLVGFLARLGALNIIIIMIVAIAQVHAKDGFLMLHFDQNGNLAMNGKMPAVGYEYNLALIAIALAILLAGAGLISLDAVLFRRGLWARGPQPLGNPLQRTP